MADNKDETNTYKFESELPIIPHVYKLNWKNYLKWSKLVKTTLIGKRKAKQLIDAPPKEKDPKFDKWDIEDSVIITWLWALMTPEISDTCMFLSTAKEIWKALKDLF